MKIILIKENLAIGGAETLMVRMCNWFCTKGHCVLIVTEKRNENIEHLLDKRARILYVKNKITHLINKKNAEAFVKKVNLCDVDVIYAYHPVELPVAITLNSLFPASKLLIGVYHPNAYINRTPGNRIRQDFTKRLFSQLPIKNIVFMNSAVRDNHEKYFRSSFRFAKIWPLPLAIPTFCDFYNKSNIIISIGNLKPFKTYNTTMIDVVKELRNKGCDIKYEIYGKGPLKKTITGKIKKYNLQEFVQVFDQVDYNMFHNTARRGFVFVGLGTAALEAAAASVPSIVSVAYSREPISFGYVDRLPDFVVGEPVENFSYVKIADLIQSLLNMSDKGYDSIRQTGYNYVKSKYDLDKTMCVFLQLVENTPIINCEIYANIIRKVYLLTMFDDFKNRIKLFSKNIFVRIKSLLYRF